MAAIRSSEISKTEYEVFLSFRGPDTRQGFTDVLYDHLKESGIQVFRDDDELAIGDTIELILDAIRNSKICVPIFSKSFASSAWCLREVAKMVELNKDIVPIFYDVTPEDVKLKTPLYVDQLKEHQQGKPQLEQWEKALVQVGRIKGRALNKMGFVEFSKKFKAEILLKLRVKQKYTIKHLVELPDEVEHALKLLEIESVDVRFLGMYGMGGVGKTTLAKILFNRISSGFDSCSFLPNIREEYGRKGVEYLRTKLLRDLNPKAANDNMDVSDNWDEKMEKCVRMKSVLIVLDDVGKRSHVEELVGGSISFGSRSRIIITTRDDRVLLMNVGEASSSGEGRPNLFSCITKMKVKGMSPEQAMQLFSRHAFGTDCPPKDFTSLSEDIVSISGGLPLALEVIGSLLYGMSVEAWEHKVSKLKTIPADDVQEKLMISYNALEDDVKEIFLDIACFFIDEDKSNPMYMWEGCGFSPNWAVPVLVSMSLIQITDDGKFWMHDQLRDLGREIVRIKGFNSSTSKEGSRIQTYEDAFYVHARNKEKDVAGLRLRGSDDKLTDLADFGSLRFLQVDMTFHHRNFWRLSTDIRWLSLRLNKQKLTAPIIINVFSMAFRNRDSSYLMKLVVLDLSDSDITDSWKGWILIQELRRLKVLDLSRCRKLTRTPNFSKMEALEKLILRGCLKLAKIDSSIGKLRKLKYLNLAGCVKLKELPKEVGNLEDLEQIIMSRTDVSKLPDSIEKLKNLGTLIFDSGSLKELPATLGLLVKLEHLDLSYCGIDKLPDSIGDLTSLVSLDLLGCTRIRELPSSITRLEKLERLSLQSCKMLVKLPDDLGNLKSLVELDFSFTKVGVVPESIGDLASIQVINLSKSPVSVLPGTIAQLSLLQTLNLCECNRIETVIELPTSLTILKLNVRSLRQLPDLSKLSRLRELRFDDEGWGVRSLLREQTHFKFDAMEKLLRLELLDLDLESQTSLPAEFSALTMLKSLQLTCPNLTCIPPFPSSLQTLTLKNLGRNAKLPCLSNLNKLSQLVFSGCSMEGGMLDCGVDRLESLIQLTVIKWHHTVKKLPDLSRLKRLEMLNLVNCEELAEIPGLETLVSLKKLRIHSCDSLERLENMKNLTSLRHVEIRNCKNFIGIQNLEEMRVPIVCIYECKCKDIDIREISAWASSHILYGKERA